LNSIGTGSEIKAGLFQQACDYSRWKAERSASDWDRGYVWFSRNQNRLRCPQNKAYKLSPEKWKKLGYF
jgi:hypothetical protein